MDGKQLWQAVLGDMQVRLTRTAFDNWLRQTTLVDFANDVATVAAPNTFSVSTLRSRYTADIERSLREIVGRDVSVQFTVLNAGVDEQTASNAAPTIAPPALLGDPAPAGRPAQPPTRSVEPAMRRPAPSAAPSRMPRTNRQLPLEPIPANGLNPRYVYASYVAGSSNRFAHAASLSVAEHPGGKYNPFFIYGGVGLGKTHLLHAIGNRALELHPGITITYVSSEKFTNDVIDAIRAQRMDDFRARYRSIDILMIDDIQFIAGKEATQEEFFHTFNALYQSGKQVVISSDKPPKSIGGLAERLRSRFEGGLVADVQLPDYEMRTAILRAKGEELGIAIPAEVIEYVAQRDESNIRELEGVLNRILAFAEMNGGGLTLQLAIQALAETGGLRRTKVTADEVVEAISNHFGVSLTELRGRSRAREIVVPRQLAMFIIREEVGASLVDIGQSLGGRDHTTIMHGIEKMERDLNNDPTLRGQLNAVREALHSGA